MSVRVPKALKKLARRARWRVQARFGRPLPSRFGDARATAIVASFARMRNVAPIVRTFLRCGFVERVIVSNHAPWVRIGEWVDVRDPRLRLVDETLRRPCGHRWQVARSAPGDHFVVVDDDVFVRPAQLEELFRRLLEAPAVPHGLHGARIAPRDAGIPHASPPEWIQVRRRETEVEVLHKVFCVHREGVERYFALRDALAERDPALGELVDDLGDDLVISAAGRGRPRVHDVGGYAECRSAQQRGVALSSREGFRAVRERIRSALRDLESRGQAPRADASERRARAGDGSRHGGARG